MDATEVHLDGNNMTELANPGFIGRRRVTTVYLNASSIRRLETLNIHIFNNNCQSISISIYSSIQSPANPSSVNTLSISLSIYLHVNSIPG